MIAWEYKEATIAISESESGKFGFEGGLNELGKGGWELIRFEIGRGWNNQDVACCLFKRPAAPVAEDLGIVAIDRGPLGAILEGIEQAYKEPPLDSDED